MEELPLFQQPKPAKPVARAQPWSVSDLTKRIKGVVEPPFRNVWIKGEVSNLRPAASGHLYFSLKDDQSSISAAIFGWGRRRSPFELKDGLEVLCTGKVSVYPPRGTYQLVIDTVEPLGAGALQLAFEQLKSKLASEGLFDRERKRALPAYPKKIVVVTSPSGAAIRDMQNVISRRAPSIEVLLVPAVVQGQGAGEQVRKALELANRYKLGELVILARGGGSIEDLWCFNDESLARAIAESELPVLSAVGHEIDFTISDFAADVRAPTPSAAAEMISENWVRLEKGLRESHDRLVQAIRGRVSFQMKSLDHLAARIRSPRERLLEQSQRCDEISVRLQSSIQNLVRSRRLTFEQWVGKLNALSPLQVLERGYSIVRKGNAVVTKVQQVKKGTLFEFGSQMGNSMQRCSRGLCLALMLVLGCASTPSAKNIDHQWKLSQTQATDGSLVIVTGKGAVPGDFQGQFGKRTFRFFAGSAPDTVQALFAVPYDFKAGEHQVIVRHHGNEVAQLGITVAPGKYKSEKLRVDPRLVSPPKKALKRIKREGREIGKIYREMTEQRFWDRFQLPVKSKITSPFGTRRLFNGQKRGFHRGVDLRAPTGTPIYAPAGGRVELSKGLYFSGNTVILNHGFGLVTLYAHMSKLKVKKGQIVKPGQVLGLSGETGRVNGPHLHWGAVVNREKFNPLDLTRID